MCTHASIVHAISIDLIVIEPMEIISSSISSASIDDDEPSDEPLLKCASLYASE